MTIWAFAVKCQTDKEKSQLQIPKKSNILFTDLFYKHANVSGHHYTAKQIIQSFFE